MLLTCQAMASGLSDVLTSSSLFSLTPEDLRLLLNGCGDVSVDQLKKYTSFNDETGMRTLKHACLHEYREISLQLSIQLHGQMVMG